MKFAMLVRLLPVAVVATQAEISRADISGGYIYKGDNEVNYLTVTESNHKLTGYLQSLGMALYTDAGCSASKLTFEGEISGNSFTLWSAP